MITPDFLSEIMAKTQNSLNGVSEEILKKLARRLEATITRYGKNDLIPTSLNEIYNLEEAGLAYADIQKAIEDALPEIRNEVREAFQKAAAKMDEYYGGGVRETYNGDNNTKTEEQPERAPEMPQEKPTPKRESNKKESKSSGKYPDFIKTTGYGSMLGLCGINCRHTFSVFVPNIMDDTPDKIDRAANDKRYAAEQQARAMERQIREKKQLLAALKGMQDADKDKIAELVKAINDLIKDYQAFCRKNKITMSEWRLATVSDTPKKKPAPAVKVPKPRNISPNMQDKMENVYKRTNGDIKNICQTTASATQQSFINACDNAFMQVQAGKPVTQAISDAIEEMAKAGVGCVYYDSGRRDRIEVALARAIRTGVNQANAQLILMKCAEMGVDYVKVSSHYGARVTKKNDYTNHAWWQGKVYHLNWNDPVLSGFKKNESENNDNVAPENKEKPNDKETPNSKKPIRKNTIGTTIKQSDRKLDKIDQEAFSNVNPKISTDEAVITGDRISHVYGRHPEAVYAIDNIVSEALKKPTFIFEDKYNPGGVAYLVYYKPETHEYFKIIVYMAIEGGEYKENNVWTFMRINEKTARKYARNKKLLYNGNEMLYNKLKS